MPSSTPARFTLSLRTSLLHEKRQMPREVPSDTDRVVKRCWVQELRLAISAVTQIDYKQDFCRAIYDTGLELDEDAPGTAKQD